MKEVEEAIMLLKAAADKISKNMDRVALKVEVKELERAFELLRPWMRQEAATA